MWISCQNIFFPVARFCFFLTGFRACARNAGMQTDERPPPEPWYKKLVPASLTRVWETVKTDWREAKEEAEREDPWHVRTCEEISRIAWQGATGKIPTDEAFRLIHEVKHRRDTVMRQLRGDDPAVGAPANE